MKRRRVIQLVLLLLLLISGGAIVNVAVAWGSAFWISLDWFSPGHDVYAGYYDHKSLLSSYSCHRFRQASACRVTLYKGGRSGAVMRDTEPLENLIPSWGRNFLYVPELFDESEQASRFPDGFGYRLVDARGWPWLSVWGGIGRPNHDVQSEDQWIVHGAIPLQRYSSTTSSHHLRPRFLPVIPLWPGFAINTIFYAAMLWVLFFVPGKLKRTLRRMRGQCPACAYPIGTSPVCTECGAALSAPLR